MNSPRLISSAKETLTKSKKIKKHTPSINSHLLEPMMEQKSKTLKKDSNSSYSFINIWILDSTIIIKKSITCSPLSHPNFLTFLKLRLLLDKMKSLGKNIKYNSKKKKFLN